MLDYPPLHVRVVTPTLELAGATDDLLGELQSLVRDGKATASPAPFDDPMSLYEDDPDRRVRSWLQGVWRGRGRVTADFWRLYFVVLVEGRAVGMQDLIGDQFGTFGTVTTFSWLSIDERRHGLGTEMRQAILHLAFEGLGATEASSEGFIDNTGSNGISRRLGYLENGLTRATRLGEPALLQRWRLTREDWTERRRNDIALSGVAECKQALRLS